MSGWFRSEGFDSSPSRIQILLGHSSQDNSVKYDMTECDGEWTYFEFVQTVTTGNEALTIIMDSKGKVWFDDLEIYEVEDIAGEWCEVEGATNLLAGSEKDEVIGGDFEYNLEVIPMYVDGDAETGMAFGEIVVDNSVMMNPEAELIIAVYDDYGRLVKLEMTKWENADKEAGEAPAEFVPNQHYVALESEGYADGCEVKIFAWDGIIPLGESLSNI